LQEAAPHGLDLSDNRPPARNRLGFFDEAIGRLTRPAASAVTLVAMIASFALLSLSMKSLPLGTAPASARSAPLPSASSC